MPITYRAGANCLLGTHIFENWVQVFVNIFKKLLCISSGLVAFLCRVVVRLVTGFMSEGGVVGSGIKIRNLVAVGHLQLATLANILPFCYPEHSGLRVPFRSDETLSAGSCPMQRISQQLLIAPLSWIGRSSGQSGLFKPLWLPRVCHTVSLCCARLFHSVVKLSVLAEVVQYLSITSLIPRSL